MDEPRSCGTVLAGWYSTMKSRLASRIRSRPISSAVLGVFGLGIACFVLWQAVIWSQWSQFAAGSWAVAAVGRVEVARTPAVSEAISRVAGEQESAVMPYDYRGRTYIARIEVPAAELRLSRSLPTEFVFASRGPLRAAYLRVMVRSAQSDPVVSATCVQLRETRDRLGLDADEYAELISRFVQQIPYGPAEPRFAPPTAVIADGHAVCADKSVLLAALLVHEGYDAAMVAIDSNNHAAAAVRGTGPGYLRSGYAYVETTVDSYIGEVPPEGEGAGRVEARTQIVSVGGSGRYTSDLESQFVGETLIRARRAARSLKPYRAYALKATGESKRCFAGMAEQHVEAERLARELRLTTDDRARTFALLTRSGGR
jgi:hypothetical protein